MANVDVGYGNTGRARPQAIVESYRLSVKADQPAPRPPRAAPQFSRINAGQFVRTLLLIALCMGVVGLTRAERADAETAAAALKSI